MNRLRKFWRSLKGKDRKAHLAYLNAEPTPRLHLGASNRVLPHWLNTDISPTENVSYLDATRPFPFLDATFDFIYTEHMIEHLPYADAQFMISECQRVMKPGGVLRIITPDLNTLLLTTNHPANPQAEAYLRWMTKTFIPDAPKCSPSYVINAMFRMWGHQFIYDLDSLSSLLSSAGFINITQCSINDSSHSDLMNLSNADRYPPSLLDFESLCVEATHP